MVISNMNEQAKNKIHELYLEFWKRINEIPEPTKSNILDGGQSEANEILNWYKAEVKKVKEQYEVS